MDSTARYIASRVFRALITIQNSSEYYIYFNSARIFEIQIYFIRLNWYW